MKAMNAFLFPYLAVRGRNADRSGSPTPALSAENRARAWPGLARLIADICAAIKAAIGKALRGLW
jgi:hypothetical protein